ncbi:MAG: hypothetical protein PVI21_00015 [Candidatus Woesebacteria bacterium]|jgi:hypothetical protein
MQNHPILQPPKNYVKKHKKAFTVLFILLLISGAISYWYIQSSHNLAKDIAKPIENSLIQAGATKVCEHGDPGHGPDNFSPWYRVYFEYEGDTQSAEKILSRALSAVDYSLGNVDGGYGYLGDYVYKTDSTNASYDIIWALTNSGTLHACEGGIYNDDDHTAIAIEIQGR